MPKTTDIKNTLKTEQSTKPFVNRVPPKNPFFGQFNKTPNFSAKFNQFRTQNRGGGGK